MVKNWVRGGVALSEGNSGDNAVGKGKKEGPCGGANAKVLGGSLEQPLAGIEKHKSFK